MSQAAGSGVLDVCGLYLNRGIIVMTFSFILCCFVFIYNCEAILVKLGQEEAVVLMTKMFLTY